MHYVYSILIFILMAIFALAAIGFAIKSPNTSDKKENKNTNTAVGLCVVLAIVCFFWGKSEWNNDGSISKDTSTIATSSSVPSKYQSNSVQTPKSNNTTNTNVVTEKPVYSIGLNPEQFKQSFNQASDASQTDFNISDLNVTDGAVQNTFQYMFTDNLGLIGTVNKKDGSIRSVSLMGQGDGTLNSGADIFIGMGLLIQATDPKLTPDERGNILRDLGLLDQGVDILNLDKSIIRNGFKYTFTSSKEIGIMFSIGNANDQ